MRKAVILAAGRGTRMQALTATRPKPMLEVAGKPLLEHIAGRLGEAGFDDLLIITGYHAEMIEKHFAGWRLPVAFKRQETPNGTGAAALLAKRWAGDEPFLLTFGDIVMAGEDYRAMACVLDTQPECEAVMAVQWVDDPAAGAAVYEQAGRVERVVEKPPALTSATHWNSAGGYAFRPGIFDELERIPMSPRGEYEITSAIEQLLAAGRRVMIHAVRGAWRDVGRPEDLIGAGELFS